MTDVAKEFEGKEMKNSVLQKKSDKTSDFGLLIPRVFKVIFAANAAIFAFCRCGLSPRLHLLCRHFLNYSLRFPTFEHASVCSALVRHSVLGSSISLVL
ncbi:hypothetical protein P8452_01897 [Trifolium repens]|nr:hypothetical protein P8452_01897 [Trifolium repens]